MGQPIKSIAAILRGVPRGKVSVAGGNFFDPKDNELLFGYPFGGGSLFVAGGMDSPVLIIESREKDRKSTRLNSSHGYISYAVFCLKETYRAVFGDRRTQLEQRAALGRRGGAGGRARAHSGPRRGRRLRRRGADPLQRGELRLPD